MWRAFPTEQGAQTTFGHARIGNSESATVSEGGSEVATIEKTIDVAVPVSVAYDQWTQFEEFPQFMTGIVQVRQLDDSHVRWVAEVEGERQEWDAEIVEQVPDRVVAWRATNGLENSGRVEFEPIDSGARTRVSVEMEYDPEGLKEQLGALIGVDGRQVEKDLERFRELVEAREVPTGAWRGTIESGDVVESDPR
jgi:uncharacterized membrane protein